MLHKGQFSLSLKIPRNLTRAWDTSTVQEARQCYDITQTNHHQCSLYENSSEIYFQGNEDLVYDLLLIKRNYFLTLFVCWGPTLYSILHAHAAFILLAAEVIHNSVLFDQLHLLWPWLRYNILQSLGDVREKIKKKKAVNLVNRGIFSKKIEIFRDCIQ